VDFFSSGAKGYSQTTLANENLPDKSCGMFFALVASGFSYHDGEKEVDHDDKG